MDLAEPGGSERLVGEAASIPTAPPASLRTANVTGSNYLIDSGLVKPM